MSVLCEGECPCKSLSFSLSMWTAAQYGDIHRIQQIGHKNPSSLRKCDSYGYTALHYASQSGYVGIVKYLLQQKVLVDANECGATPLHRAAYSGRLEVCNLLLQYGANVYAVDSSIKDSAMPVDKALQQGHYKIVELLLKHMSDEHKSKYSQYLTERPIIIDTKMKYLSVETPQPSLPIYRDGIESSIYCPEIKPIESQLSTGLSCSMCGMTSLSFSTVNKKLVCLKCRYKKTKMTKIESF
jgi:Ankyrin repeats (3 copies)